MIKVETGGKDVAAVSHVVTARISLDSKEAAVRVKAPTARASIPGVVVGGGGLDQATADQLYVNVGGDTMTGPLTISSDYPNLIMDATLNGGTAIEFRSLGAEEWLVGPNGITGDFVFGVSIGPSNYMESLKIDRTDGMVLLPASPTEDMHAATKAYVDANSGGGGGGLTEPEADLRYVNVGGDVMLGELQAPSLRVNVNDNGNEGLRFYGSGGLVYQGGLSVQMAGSNPQSALLYFGGTPLTILAGGVQIASPVSMLDNQNQVVNRIADLADPVDPQDAATKAYVDAVLPAWDPVADEGKVLQIVGGVLVWN